MTRVERLITAIDLDERDPEHAVRARHQAALADGRRVLLLDDRGWGSSVGVNGYTVADVEDTARTVVGPDEPWGEQTREQVDQGHWSFLEDKLRDAGVSVTPGELKGLEHDVEMSERLRARLVDAPER